jgi:wyosine [tRNA(Phe)-imidazoG37] synthetase (radical SAM superfamily)
MAKIKYVFGPVASRRLGISLGLDIIPYKTCTLDCVYCECGKTTVLTLERKRFMDPQIVLDQIEAVIKGDKHIQYITFSGSGEPTLNKDIGWMIHGIKQMTDIPVAILTNGTLLHMKEVRKDIADADLVLPSLDAVTPAAFKRINKHHEGLDIDTYINGIKTFRKEFNGPVWLEVFIAKGINDSEEEIDHTYRVVKEIDPDLVQLNSLDRPPAYKDIQPVDRKFLEAVAKKWQDLPVEIVNRVKKREEITAFSSNLENNILNTIQRRPLTIDDLEALTGKDRSELFKYIDVLEKEKKVRPKIVGDRIFYASHSQKGLGDGLGLRA